MFILRGLPGSGKSTLAKNISLLYKSSCSICCADDFQYKADSDSKVSHENKNEALRLCEKKAGRQCSLGRPVVIIDEVNLDYEHMKCYFEMAYNWNYCVVVLEPSTPWKDDSFLLSQKCVHGLDATEIEEIKTSYECMIYPLYFGFIFSASDSATIQCEIEYVVHECTFYSSEFSSSIFQASDGITGLFQTYTRMGVSSPPDMLHITSLFTQKGSTRKLRSYCQSTEVCSMIGRVSDVMIVGLCITPRSIFARVQLTDEQKTVWGLMDSYLSDNALVAVNNKKVDRNIFRANQNRKKSTQNSDGSTKNLSKRRSSVEEEESVKESIARFSDDLPDEYLVPNYHTGCLAHITLGLHGDTSAAQCLEDLNILTQLELSMRPQVEVVAGHNLLRLYSGCWVVYLRQALIIPALFSGFY